MSEHEHECPARTDGYAECKCVAILRTRLAQAEADRDRLAVEVRAWRERVSRGFDQPGDDPLIAAACAATDASGALKRAKGDTNEQG